MQINPMGRASKKGLKGVWNIGGAAIEAGMEFFTRREMNPNESVGKSAAMAGLTFAEWALFPGIMAGITVGQIGYEVAKQASEYGASLPTQHAMRYGGAVGGQIGNGFQDSDVAYTARQRGIQAIQNSRMNARSVLGNEARSLHGR